MLSENFLHKMTLDLLLDDLEEIEKKITAVRRFIELDIDRRTNIALMNKDEEKKDG